MPQHAKLPEESIAERASPANDPTVTHLPEPAIDFDDDAGPLRAPLRFGRLALWMASASALGIGVLGTVAYGMWFNHDQRVYAEAMASARRTLGIDQPAIAAQTQSGGVVETPLSAVSGAPAGTVPYPSIESASLADNAPVADATDETVVADGSGAAAAGTAALATTAAQPQTQLAVQRRGSPSATQRAAVDRGNRADRADQYAQSRRHQSQQTRAKPDSGLFARVGAFFHRVSYRHNVPTRQREEYSRP